MKLVAKEVVGFKRPMEGTQSWWVLFFGAVFLLLFFPKDSSVCGGLLKWQPTVFFLF